MLGSDAIVGEGRAFGVGAPEDLHGAGESLLVVGGEDAGAKLAVFGEHLGELGSGVETALQEGATSGEEERQKEGREGPKPGRGGGKGGIGSVGGSLHLRWSVRSAGKLPLGLLVDALDFPAEIGLKLVVVLLELTADQVLGLRPEVRGPGGAPAGKSAALE